jgi:hypothetical protein
MAKKWYADKKVTSIAGGCVYATKKDPRTRRHRLTESGEEWVCFIQHHDNRPPYRRNVPLHETRCELIAMLPELVEAASLLNSLAGWGTENTLPSVKRKLPKIDRLIRRAVELLANEPDLEGGAK